MDEEREVTEPTDMELMAQVKAGDLGRSALLFERHHEKLFHFCHRMTGDRVVSEDLVQEVFLRMLKYRRSFRGDSEFLPWIYRLARNVCNDHFARVKRQPVDAANVPEPVSEEASARETLEKREQLCMLRRALLRLPVERREVLVLSRFELRNYAEIAQLLDCSVGAVKVRVHRAVRQLREIYVRMLAEATT